MKKTPHNASNRQGIALEGFDVQPSGSQDNVPGSAPQPQKRLSVVYGTCCKCKNKPATLKSPSGQSIYCVECGTSRCGIHTVRDFKQEEGTGLWLDPCCIKIDLKQQSLTEEK